MAGVEAKTPLVVRQHLVDALRADLVGPCDLGGRARGKLKGAARGASDVAIALPHELLEMKPSRWYLTGFLANEVQREVEEDVEDGEMGAGDDLEPGQDGAAEPEVRAKRFLPASTGLTILVRPDTRAVTVRVRWADYVRVDREDLEKLGEHAPTRDDEDEKRGHTHWWRRMPRAWQSLEIGLPPASGDGTHAPLRTPVPDSAGVELMTQVERADSVHGLAQGTLAVTVFLVNRRREENALVRDESYLFQVELELHAPGAIVARPDHQLETSPDTDDKILDLQYRDVREWAVGHGCAPEPILAREDGEGGEVIGARLNWIPTAEVVKVKTHELPEVEVRMEQLAALAKGNDVGALLAAMAALPEAYEAWIHQQHETAVGSAARETTRGVLVERARAALKRIRDGLMLLERDDDVRLAFALMNAAMAAAQRKRRPDAEPKWRLFQLAFVLLNLRGITDPKHEDRECVDLIFFPTGGGKTEAYLGVIGFTLLLRRLHGQIRPDKGLGVAVLLRYTLRLLTLDQLERAAGLVCALELQRLALPNRLGREAIDRFALGLWVGRSASANRLEDAKKAIEAYRGGTSDISPFPLTKCPWCGTPIAKQCLFVMPRTGTPKDIVVQCTNRSCEFARGIPVLFVDEQVYRQLPCFVIATVDKFAMVPWRAEASLLFGKVHSRIDGHFYGPGDGERPGSGAVNLPGGLRPPELIVQDELHLISGPLGTMVGLYETMVDRLSTDADGARPKIIAATATVRRSHQQIRALFGRPSSAVFPPAGVDAWETFFATVDRDGPKRQYVGVAAAGRPIKRILIFTYLALLAAAQKAYDDSIETLPDGTKRASGDAYMTLVGYFNSLRELGGMRRLVEDEIHGRVEGITKRKPVNWPGRDHPWFANRKTTIPPIELTSREKTGKIGEHKAKLAEDWAAAHVDVCLASNMISVGVDIDRLGLMVVAGQPKTTSEYIQASSRVGRSDRGPGLVVTVFNLHKPRDRSHYEHFGYYHEAFYRTVEAQSVTPFSGPAIERGLAGVLVGMTRHGDGALTQSRKVAELRRYRHVAEAMVAALAERARQHSDRHLAQLAEDLSKRGKALLDSWEAILDAAIEGGGTKHYSGFDEDRTGTPLLITADKRDEMKTAAERKFVAPTSMRDVEASVNVFVDRTTLRHTQGGGR